MVFKGLRRGRYKRWAVKTKGELFLKAQSPRGRPEKTAKKEPTVALASSKGGEKSHKISNLA